MLIEKSFGNITQSSEFYIKECVGRNLTLIFVIAAISELSALIENVDIVPKLAMYCIPWVMLQMLFELESVMYIENEVVGSIEIGFKALSKSNIAYN